MGRANAGYPVQMLASQQEWAFSSSECRSISERHSFAACSLGGTCTVGLSRADNCDARPPPHEQKVPAYTGTQSCHYTPANKSKPYYHTTYPEPPSKSLMHGIMVKLVGSMNEKNIPFSFVVDDMPTHKTIVQLKAENPKLFKDIVPILGAFHLISMLSIKDSRSLAGRHSGNSRGRSGGLCWPSTGREAP